MLGRSWFSEELTSEGLLAAVDSQLGASPWVSSAPWTGGYSAYGYTYRGASALAAEVTAARVRFILEGIQSDLFCPGIIRLTKTFWPTAGGEEITVEDYEVTEDGADENEVWIEVAPPEAEGTINFQMEFIPAEE